MVSVMETDRPYPAESALHDVADVRARANAATQLDVSLWWYLPIAAAMPVTGLGFVIEQQPWRYGLPIVSLVLAIAAVSYLGSTLERKGVHPKVVRELRGSPPAMVLVLVTVIAYVLTPPLTDAFDWNGWTVPAVGLVCSLAWLGAIVYVTRSSRRRADPPAAAPRTL